MPPPCTHRHADRKEVLKERILTEGWKSWENARLLYGQGAKTDVDFNCPSHWLMKTGRSSGRLVWCRLITSVFVHRGKRSPQKKWPRTWGSVDASSSSVFSLGFIDENSTVASPLFSLNSFREWFCILLILFGFLSDKNWTSITKMLNFLKFNCVFTPKFRTEI